MEFSDFFKDPKTGEPIEHPLRGERREEMLKWIDENTFIGKGKVYRPGELNKEIKARMELRDRQRKQEQDAQDQQDQQNNPNSEAS